MNRWRQALAANRIDRDLGERHALEDLEAGRFYYTPDELFDTESDYQDGYLTTWNTHGGLDRPQGAGS